MTSEYRWEVSGVASRVRLFISAGPELEPEREVIGRALAGFPINLGWEIKRTPWPEEPADLKAVRGCDFFVMLFASDIRAPVGWEWIAARRAERVPLAFLKQGVLRTPAGREFVRAFPVEWRRFRTGQELAKQAMEALSEQVLARWQGLGLSGREWEVLSAYLAQLRGEKPEEEDETQPTGAAGGGVILAPGRDLPTGGVVVKD